STGVENKPKELSEVKIYPQPAEGSFWFDLKNMEAGNLTIQLFDMVGREIYTYSQAVPGGDNIIEISIPDVDTGTYLLKTSGVHLGIQKLIVR
ncbi:MAG: T9SS type A sorting domain-containing protein, partial [Bacteroidetes bacterium]|nr:T9SS type A sorting domain-containing protein [Bacteroidota bacterium]